MKNTLSDRLNYLTTIAEEQSITRAATRLFISQPALTAFLSRTEEELGTRLFDRTSTPIRITLSWLFILHSIISALPFSLSAESQISQQITERSCLLRSLVDRDFSPDAQAVPGQNVPRRGCCRSTDDAAPAPCVR